MRSYLLFFFLWIFELKTFNLIEKKNFFMTKKNNNNKYPTAAITSFRNCTGKQ